MESYSEQMAQKVTMIIQKNRDAEKGFAKASKIAKAKSLATWFSDKSVERRMFNEDLKKEALRYGLQIDESGSLKGDLHRTWMDFKALFSTDNDQAMLQEVERGEKAALIEYNEILGEMGLPSTTEMLLTTQGAKIEQGLTVLKNLEDIEYQEES